MNVLQSHNRVGIFHSIEVQEEALAGEWVRDAKRSTQPLAELVNEFLEKNKATVLFTSAPQIEMLGMTADKKTRTYRCSLSIIYQPVEVIYDQGTKQSADERFTPAKSKTPETNGIVLDGVPDEQRQAVLDALIQRGVNPRTGLDTRQPKPGSKRTVKKPRAAGVAKSWQEEGRQPPKQPAVSHGGNKPDKRRDQGRGLQRLPRPARKVDGAGR